MTAPHLVPAADLVTDVIEERLTPRECLAILRAKGMTPDVEALADAVHFARRLNGLEDGTLDALSLFDGHWPGRIGAVRDYAISVTTDALDEALERLSARATVAV